MRGRLGGQICVGLLEQPALWFHSAGAQTMPEHVSYSHSAPGTETVDSHAAQYGAWCQRAVREGSLAIEGSPWDRNSIQHMPKISMTRKSPRLEGSGN